MRRGPIGGSGEGGYVDQELWELAEGGLWLWSISLYGSSVRVNLEGGFLCWRP